MIVGLADLKAHLRVDSDSEDFLIATFGEAAEQQVREWLGRPIYRTLAEMPQIGSPGYNQAQMAVDNTIVVSIMMIAERLYRERGGEGDGMDNAVPPASVRALLAGHRVFASGCR